MAVLGVGTCDSAVKVVINSEYSNAHSAFHLAGLTISQISDECESTKIEIIVRIRASVPGDTTPSTYAYGDAIKCSMLLPLKSISPFTNGMNPAIASIDQNKVEFSTTTNKLNNSIITASPPTLCGINGKAFVLSDLKASDVSNANNAIAIQIATY
jgi:hypothetical protein